MNFALGTSARPHAAWDTLQLERLGCLGENVAQLVERESPQRLR